MPRDDSPDEVENTLAARVGGASAGTIAGLAIGTILAVLLTGAGAHAAAGWSLFLCTAGGAVAGYLSATAGLGLLEGISHFLAGVLSGLLEHEPIPSRFAPQWLRQVLLFGTIFGLALLLAWQLWL